MRVTLWSSAYKTVIFPSYSMCKILPLVCFFVLPVAINDRACVWFQALWKKKKSYYTSVGISSLVAGKTTCKLLLLTYNLQLHFTVSHQLSFLIYFMYTFHLEPWGLVVWMSSGGSSHTHLNLRWSDFHVCCSWYVEYVDRRRSSVMQDLVLFCLKFFFFGNPNLPDPVNFVPFGTMTYSPFDINLMSITCIKFVYLS